MKTLLSIAAALAAIASASASVAFAHGAPTTGIAGHYEWQSRLMVGPRAPLSVQTRVWVGDAMATASCDCAMMHDTAMSADYMAMQHKGPGTSHG
ncbi:MAG: hypothetical protein NVS3B5_16140 [Sphingomicrobium sp.]